MLTLLDSVLPYTLMALAARSIPAGESAVLISTMPLFTALFASAFAKDESISTSALAGLALGFVGVAVLVGPEALDPRRGVSAGHAAALAGALTYGASTVYSRRVLKEAGAVEITVLKVAIGSLIVVPMSLAVDGAPVEFLHLSAGAIVALLMLGVVSTGLGRLLYLWVIGEVGSVRASLVTYIIPVAGLALAWVVLGEQPAPATIAGCGLIVAGIAGVLSKRGVTQVATVPTKPALAGLGRIS